MKTFIVSFCIALFIFGFVRDYNEGVKKEQARKKEVDINYMWIQQLKNGTDIASRIKKGVDNERL